MTNQEFSQEFDTLLNSWGKNISKALGVDLSGTIVLDEYEKSVFLTKAQEELIKEVYSKAFEATEEMRKYLANLVETAIISNFTTTSDEFISDTKAIGVTLPTDLWYITFEAIHLTSDDVCLNNKELEVIPVTQDEYHRIKGNPFRGPNNDRALRLDLANNKVEIISNYKDLISKYIVRYLKRPSPIILINLTNENLSINNVSVETACSLNDVFHKPILDKAVELAIKSKVGNTQNK